mmetsp:Transcript_38998/g.72065  ORF Transcript_38998/g.72065 Transcript_38998/m.72065 type:complete len:156 (-) Transcript_38998:3-470(-)
MKSKRFTSRVAEKFTIKSRFGRARGDACSTWRERAQAEGRQLNEFQKKICPKKDAGNETEPLTSVSDDKPPNIEEDPSKLFNSSEASNHETRERVMESSSEMDAPTSKDEMQQREQFDDEADMIGIEMDEENIEEEVTDLKVEAGERVDSATELN